MFRKYCSMRNSFNLLIQCLMWFHFLKQSAFHISRLKLLCLIGKFLQIKSAAGLQKWGVTYRKLRKITIKN